MVTALRGPRTTSYNEGCAYITLYNRWLQTEFHRHCPSRTPNGTRTRSPAVKEQDPNP